MSQDFNRSVAKRVLASEINMADYHFKESDGQYEPNYLLLPSGERANRVLIGGTLVNVEDVSKASSDHPFWRATINDGPTGEITAVAGQYNKEASNFFQMISNDDTMPPAYVVMIGKTDEYRPEDDESEVYINIKPESISIVDSDVRDRVLFESAKDTLERLEKSTGEYVTQAEERYGNRAELMKDDVVSTLEHLQDNVY